MNKRRRRKLHRGEFAEHGFPVSWQFEPVPSDDFRDAFWNAFLLFLLAQDLTFGGGDDGQNGSGFVCQALRGSTTEAQRESVGEWLRQQEKEGAVTGVVVGEVSDAWHGPERQYLQCVHWLTREENGSSGTVNTIKVILPPARGAEAARLARRKRSA